MLEQGTDTTAEAKSALRARVRAARRARSAREREAAAVGLRDVAMQIPAVRSAGVVACYLSMPGEPGTAPLRAALAAAGVRVLLPVVAEVAGAPVLAWALDDGEPAAPGRMPWLLEPTGPVLGPDAIGQADVVLVPALAVDTLGRRLGQGGGYYDRALASARTDAPLVAVVHDDELFDAGVEPVPALPHDRLVDAVVTPTRWQTLRP